MLEDFFFQKRFLLNTSHKQIPMKNILNLQEGSGHLSGFVPLPDLRGSYAILLCINLSSTSRTIACPKIIHNHQATFYAFIIIDHRAEMTFYL